MTNSSKDQQKQRRAQRLSAALRDNLKRRKVQARGRNIGPTAERGTEHGSAAAPSTETPGSTGFGEGKRS